jgi:outer membrane lipoprotein SlyB
MTFEATPGAVATPPNRAVWLVGGVLGLVSLAAAGTIAVHTALPPPADQAAEPARAERALPASVGTATPRGRPLAAAPACDDCGVVESVRSLTRKGAGTGLGAVAGGVVGAALGNQIGGGNGRKAMTVLGAVGGGVAGHEVEKRARSHTVHELRVRMDDGSLRTFEQLQPSAQAGDRVVVHGDTVKPASAAKG